jgi:hypothetical protein
MIRFRVLFASCLLFGFMIWTEANFFTGNDDLSLPKGMCLTFATCFVFLNRERAELRVSVLVFKHGWGRFQCYPRVVNSA